MARTAVIRRRRPWRWCPAVAVATVLLVASLARSAGPATAGTLLGVGTDRWFHAAGYAALAVAVGVAVGPDRRSDPGDRSGAPDDRRRRPSLRAALAVVAAVVGYGLGIELLQAPLSWRSFSLVDLAADAVGALLGIAGWWAVAPLAVSAAVALADRTGERTRSN